MNNIQVTKNDLLTSDALLLKMTPELASVLIEQVGGFTEFAERLENSNSPSVFLKDKIFSTASDLVSLYTNNQPELLDYLTRLGSNHGNQSAVQWVEYTHFVFDVGITDAITLALYNPKMAIKVANKKWVEAATEVMVFACNMAVGALSEVYLELLAGLKPKATRDIKTFLKSIEFDDEKMQGKYEKAPIISRSLATQVIRRMGGEDMFLKQYRTLGREGVNSNIGGFCSEIQCIQFYELNEYLMTRFLIMLGDKHGCHDKIRTVQKIILKNELCIDDVAKGLYGNGEYLDNQTDLRKKVIWNIVDRVVRHTSHQLEYHLAE